MTKISYAGYRIPPGPAPWGDPNVMLVQDRPQDRWLSAKATDFIGISQISPSGFFTGSHDPNYCPRHRFTPWWVW
jgi:hypothetical protein